MQRPRPIRILVVSTAVLLLVGMALMWGIEVIWDGEVTIRVDLTVRDARTKQPLAGAQIRCLEGSPQFWKYPSDDVNNPTLLKTVTTDTQGRSTLTWTVRASGRSNMFRHTGIAVLISEAIEVQAPGFESQLVPLGELVADHKALYRKKIIHADVELEPDLRNPSPGSESVPAVELPQAKVNQP